MATTRRLRLITVLWMLGALLWAQGALAGYACPGAAQAAHAARMAEAGMPCAEAMAAAAEPEQPSLCHAHCQSGHRSADSYQPPVLADVAQLGIVLTLDRPSGALHPPGLAPPLQRREGGPPLAISHCCLRI